MEDDDARNIERHICHSNRLYKKGKDALIVWCTLMKMVPQHHLLAGGTILETPLQIEMLQNVNVQWIECASR